MMETKMMETKMMVDEEMTGICMGSLYFLLLAFV